MTADKVNCRMAMSDAHMMRVTIMPDATCPSYRRVKVVGSLFYLVITANETDGKCRTCTFNSALISEVVKRVKEMEGLI